jgi:transcription elongation factor GreA-like protein
MDDMTTYELAKQQMWNRITEVGKDIEHVLYNIDVLQKEAANTKHQIVYQACRNQKLQQENVLTRYRDELIELLLKYDNMKNIKNQKQKRDDIYAGMITEERIIPA